MSRARTLVYDDTVEVPPDIAALVGVERFGDLLYRRRRLWEHVGDAARVAGFEHRVALRDAVDRRRTAEELGLAGTEPRYVYLTSDVVAVSAEHLAAFLEKLSYSETDLLARPEGAAPDGFAASLADDTLRRLLALRSAPQRRAWLADVPAVRLALEHEVVGIAATDALLRFLGDAFYARAFNEVAAAGRRVVVKRSADRAKMKKEHDWWYQLPPRLQRFGVQPFDHAEDAAGASYRTERWMVPDMGLLWVHGPEAVPEDAFAAFLDAVAEWLTERPTKRDPALARARAEALYVEKVERRMGDLLALPVGERLDRLVAAGTETGGLLALVERYKKALADEWARHGPGEEVAVTHGDLCLSNILFDKRTGTVRFLDPRGASSPDELWDDPYYDVAKLSHSVLGGYDFVNSELFDTTVGPGLRLALQLDRPPAGVREAAFLERLGELGFDPVRVRLYEASLFLSMLPLHAEAPHKLAAFVLQGLAALEEAEAASTRRPTLLQRWLGA